ncbi:MAG: 16S rRNA (adenine(1518)-N(6)/adenine(1519)-N(6))-dimethyltransferase RsmA [Bacilli bacterium]
MFAKKKYGQNFLINENIINDIVQLLDNIKKNDLIIEIGPGKGALTKYLIHKPCNIKCIEIDEDMHRYLDKYESEKCNIIYGDILQVDLKKLIFNYDNIYVIGNLPYYITTPIIDYLIKNINAKKMIFMVQKEVANRFTAEANTKDYGYFTLYLKYYYDVYNEIFVSKNNFNPIPKVDSEVISLNIRKNRPNIDEDKYFKLLKDAFLHKRKTLKNNLINYDFNKIKNILIKYKLNENARAEQLSEEVFMVISKII